MTFLLLNKVKIMVALFHKGNIINFKASLISKPQYEYENLNAETVFVN